MTHAAKHRIYEQFARLGKAMSASARLELLDLLVQGERSVDALARSAELSIANASQHLQVLAAARLVETRRDGQRILYRLADASVEALWLALRRTAEQRLTELDAVAQDYLTGRDEFEPIDRQELARRLKAGTVTLIDVRPTEEYEQAHIAGAISVPPEAVATWAKRAPRSKQSRTAAVPYCVYAADAVDAAATPRIRRDAHGPGCPRVAQLRGWPIETCEEASP
jgi:DNA-binding transcriptional ArsR family regulator/rhodanese-related sulfurtransferase